MKIGRFQIINAAYYEKILELMAKDGLEVSKLKGDIRKLQESLYFYKKSYELRIKSNE